MSPSVPGWSSTVRAAVDAGAVPTEDSIAALVGRSGVLLGADGIEAETERLRGSLLGLGELTPLVEDPRVTDVLVNGDGSVWIDRGGGLERSTIHVPGNGVRALAVRLAGLAGRRLDDAAPWVDGLLPHGVRLHAVLPPVVDHGAHISLRIPRAAPDSIGSLVRLGTCDPEVAEVLAGIVASRRSFLIAGSTGSGKTTLLGGLLAACPGYERIVMVEDVRELTPHHPHVVCLQGREPNVEGMGRVTMVDLVRQALRMRPDRLVVGEVRGAEVREMLAALNTGHAGAATVHANSAAEVPARLMALGALAGMTPQAVGVQVVSAVDVVLTMRRRGPLRHLVEVAVLDRSAGADPRTRAAVGVGEDGSMVRGPAWPDLVELIEGPS